MFCVTIRLLGSFSCMFCCFHACICLSSRCISPNSVCLSCVLSSCYFVVLSAMIRFYFHKFIFSLSSLFVLATQSQLRLHFTRAVIQISWQRVFLNDRDKGSFEHQNEIKMKTRQNKITSKTNCESARRFANVNNKISN